MNPSPPTVSVIVPAYNATRTIVGTIDSVLAQSRPADEILVMDDGSKDDTYAILQGYGDRIQAFTQENGGVSRARNALLRKATGSWIALLDSDDLWHPDYLATQLRLIEQAPEAVMSFTAFHDLKMGDPPPPWRDVNDTVPARVLEPREFIEQFQVNSGFVLPSFSLISRATFDRLGKDPFPLDLRGVEDVYLWYRLALEGPAVYTSERLGYYHLVESSLSHDRLKAFTHRVDAMQHVVRVYESQEDPSWGAIARRHFETSCRQAAKYWLAEGSGAEARKTLAKVPNPELRTRMLGWVSFLPRFLQPEWPKRYRY